MRRSTKHLYRPLAAFLVMIMLLGMLPWTPLSEIYDEVAVRAYAYENETYGFYVSLRLGEMYYENLFVGNLYPNQSLDMSCCNTYESAYQDSQYNTFSEIKSAALSVCSEYAQNYGNNDADWVLICNDNRYLDDDLLKGFINTDLSDWSYSVIAFFRQINYRSEYDEYDCSYNIDAENYYLQLELIPYSEWAGQNNSYTVNVIPSTGSYMSIEVTGDETVGQLKQKIQAANSSYSTQYQVLSCGDRYFDDDTKTLAFYNINSNNALYLSLVGNDGNTINDRTLTLNNNTGYYNHNAKIQHVVIGTGVTQIPNSIFYSCPNLESVTISSGSHLQIIGDSAFADCTGLTTLTGLSNATRLTSIGASAFENTALNSLTGLNNAAGLTSIGASAFKNTAIISADLSGLSQLATIGENAFKDCAGLTSVNFSGAASLSSIGNYSFYNCSKLSTADFSQLTGLTTIGNSAFGDCSDLSEIDLSNSSSLRQIGSSAFYNCKLSAVSFPQTTAFTSIGNNSFSRNSMTTVDLSGTGITSLPYSVFDNCGNLETVSLPATVSSINESAFADCNKLMCVDIDSDSENTTYVSYDGIVYNKSTGQIILWPVAKKGALNVTKDDPYFNISYCTSYPAITYITIEAGHPNYTSYNGVVFNSDMTELLRCPIGYEGSFTVTDSVTKISSEAFKDCKSLMKVNILESVRTIEASAFSGCTALSEVNFAGGVTTIGDEAFEGCTALNGIIIPSSVSTIGERAFEGCTALDSITIPSSVSTLGERAFQNCGTMTSVEIAEGFTEIPKLLFYNTNVNNFILPSTITKINVPVGDVGKVICMAANPPEFEYDYQAAFEDDIVYNEYLNYDYLTWYNSSFKPNDITEPTEPYSGDPNLDPQYCVYKQWLINLYFGGDPGSLVNYQSKSIMVPSEYYHNYRLKWYGFVYDTDKNNNDYFPYYCSLYSLAKLTLPDGFYSKEADDSAYIYGVGNDVYFNTAYAGLHSLRIYVKDGYDIAGNVSLTKNDNVDYTYTYINEDETVITTTTTIDENGSYKYRYHNPNWYCEDIDITTTTDNDIYSIQYCGAYDEPYYYIDNGTFGNATLTANVSHRTDLNDTSVKVTFADNKNAYQYTGSAVTPTITVTCGETTLTQGTDYTLSYSNNTGSVSSNTTAMITLTGTGNYYGTREVKFYINKNSLNNATVTVGNRTSYSGVNDLTDLTVKYSDTTLTKGNDYTVNVISTETNVYKVTVTGAGKYTDSKSAEFYIVADGVSGDNNSWSISKGILNIADYAALSGNGWDAHKNGITEINITDNAPKIPANLFKDYPILTKVTLPDSITTIEANAFENDGRLASINVPSALETIGDNAFKGCTALNTIGLKAKVGTSQSTSSTAFDSNIRDDAFEGYNAVLGDDIGMNFYCDIDHLTQEQKNNTTMVFSWGDKTETVNYSASSGSNDIFSCNVAVREINDTITAKIKVGDVVVSETTYSVAEYLKTIANDNGSNYSDSAKALAKSMLNYASAAQEYFNYNNNPISNVNYTVSEAREIALRNTISEKAEDYNLKNSQYSVYGLEFYGSSLKLQSKTIYFEVEDSTKFTNLTVKRNDTALTPKFHSNGKYVSYDLTDISMGDILEDIELEWSNGTNSEKFSFNPASYMELAISTSNNALKKTVKALYFCNQEAISYRDDQ